ncbi:MAG: DEAD/DEAH box helicase, partial [Planctomycetota bacterium]|nr:DEAD/DEAH box helicase [Planctomycetota bacterium]
MAQSRGDVYRVLRETFLHEEFRVGQADVVRSILRGRHTIAVLPTGGGKSLCYQLPGLLFPGTSLVISPLIALMRDQVLALRARGIAAASLHSNQSMEERRAVERALRAGELKLLYVSPERLGSPRFLDLLESVQVAFVAIDEAHCVVRWGHEFRKAYLEIGPFLKRLR